MKKSLLIAALLSVTLGAFGQGTVTFNNRATSGSPAPVVAPIFNVNPNDPTEVKSGNPVSTWNGTAGPTPAPVGAQAYAGAPLAGTGFTAAIWGANVNVPDSILTDPANAPLTTTTFRVNTPTQRSLEGFWNGSSPVVPGVVGGTADRAKFIIRVWNNQGGTITSWSQVLANDAVARGDSGIFTVNASLGLSPSIPAPNMEGLQSFQLHIVPEPSVIALGVLGAGCLFLLRRRK